MFILKALSQAVEQLRQLLLLHRRPSLESARLPALCLRGFGEQRSHLALPAAAFCRGDWKPSLDHFYKTISR